MWQYGGGFDGYIVSCRCLQKRLIYAKNRTQELYHFLSPDMAGAEGLEPSARGFGVTTDSLNMYLPL